jgi:aminomuconate-semialdehyde/2-hydroxymuconate-6-semialdehyde dehydrogenase
MSSPAILPLYVNGQFLSTGLARFDNISPVDGQLICQVAEAGEAEVAAAAHAAEQALHGPGAA